MSSPSNGNSFSVNTDSIPEELKRHRNWVLWKFELKIGTDGNPEKNPDGTDKYTKVPYTVNGRKASSTNPETWDTYEKIINTFQKEDSKFSGIGFVLSEDTGIIGIDFDHVTYKYV